MEYYVADTHSLIWYLIDSPKISKNANECFKGVENKGIWYCRSNLAKKKIM